MPLIHWENLPAAVQAHLLARMHERGLAKQDLQKLQRWIATNPEVPDGDWYKDFGTFKLAGRGSYPKTFLTKGQAAKGTPVD